MMDWSSFLLENQPYAFEKSEAIASLRAEPEDFCVDEIPSFSPSGEGEHLFLKIRKRNQNTGWLAGQIAKAANLPESAVSYAGLKDRRAVTTQWFSVHTPNRQVPDLSALWNDDIQLLETTWNNRKLKKGALQGNHFGIALRDVEGDKTVLEKKLNLITQQGVPNYVGPQRFGQGNGNLAAGEQLLAGKPRRHLSYREGLYLSALRSALFNRVLGQRVAAHSWNQQLAGDVLMLDGRGSFFRPETDDGSIAERLAAMDIHPTGVMAGKGESVVSEDVLALEQTVLNDAADIVTGLIRFGELSQRRALRLRVADLTWQWLDEASLHLSFSLPSGAFATSVLRELVQLREASDAIPVE